MKISVSDVVQNDVVISLLPLELPYKEKLEIFDLEQINERVEQQIKNLITKAFRGNADMLMNKISISFIPLKVTSTGLHVQAKVSGPDYIVNNIKNQ